MYNQGGNQQTPFAICFLSATWHSILNAEPLNNAHYRKLPHYWRNFNFESIDRKWSCFRTQLVAGAPGADTEQQQSAQAGQPSRERSSCGDEPPRADVRKGVTARACFDINLGSSFPCALAIKKKQTNITCVCVLSFRGGPVLCGMSRTRY